MITKQKIKTFIIRHLPEIHTELIEYGHISLEALNNLPSLGYFLLATSFVIEAQAVYVLTIYLKHISWLPIVYYLAATTEKVL
jgi:hypothetical protein